MKEFGTRGDFACMMLQVDPTDGGGGSGGQSGGKKSGKLVPIVGNVTLRIIPDIPVCYTDKAQQLASFCPQ